MMESKFKANSRCVVTCSLPNLPDKSVVEIVRVDWDDLLKTHVYKTKARNGSFFTIQEKYLTLGGRAMPENKPKIDPKKIREDQEQQEEPVEATLVTGDSVKGNSASSE